MTSWQSLAAASECVSVRREGLSAPISALNRPVTIRWEDPELRSDVRPKRAGQSEGWSHYVDENKRLTICQILIL